MIPRTLFLAAATGMVAAASATTVTALRFDIPADGFPVQRQTPLVLVATDTTATADSAATGFTGEVWLSGPDRDLVDLPSCVRLADGMATIPVFVRRPGVYPVLAYEPRSGLETTLTLSAPDRGGLRAEFGFEGIHGRQAIFVNQTLVPRLTLQGDPTPMPLSAHIEMRDHTGRLVLADNQSVADLANGKGRLAAPCQGMLTVEVALVTAPVSALPRKPAMPPPPDRPGKPPEPIPPMPDGVTTTTVAGAVTPLADLPTTAVVVARDRFTLWALTLSPPENKLADSPFGINAGDLFAMTEAEAETSGQARLDWQRRVGAFHSRAALPWPAIEPRKNVYEFGRVQRVVDSHQNTFLKLLAVMGPAAAWAPAGSAPTAPDDLTAWRAYGRWLFSGYKSVPFFEVWDEPNGPTWKPAPDVTAYRRLLKETHEEMTKWRGAPGKPGAGVLVAGSTAGWDSAFLEAVARDGGRDWFQAIAFHPWPAAPDKSPDANGLPARFDDLRALMRREGLLDKAAWVTALGWDTAPGGVTEDDQASYLVRAYAMAIGGRMQRLYWSDMVDGGGRVPWRGAADAGGHRGRGHMGLMDADMRPKPALAAYNLAAFMLAKVKPVPGTPTQQGAATVYSFDVARQSYKYEGGRVHVAWTEADTTTVTLDAIGGGPMSAVDALGAEIDPVQIAGPRPPRDGYEMLTYRIGSRVRGVRDAREAAAKAGKPAPAPAPEPAPGTAPDDEVCTRTFAVRVGRRPVYIWDVGLPEMDGIIPRNGLPR